VLVRCGVDTACRATQLTFKELYDDLEQYISDTEQRWKHVMRVKRYHTDSNGLGGYGGDQCYLEGQSRLWPTDFVWHSAIQCKLV